MTMTSRIAFGLAIVPLLLGGGASAQEATAITIDKIVANTAIYGQVSGLAPHELDKYKVVVYVHTDQWYIHPYAGQGESKSWTTINEDGSWAIATVRREFPADQVAALIVPRETPEPVTAANVSNVPHEAITVGHLVGTADHGKL